MNTTTINNTGVDIALKIIEEGKRPQSIDEIKAKYGLDFPFRVVKVSNPNVYPELNDTFKIGDVFEVTGFSPQLKTYGWYKLGDKWVTPPDAKQWNLASDV